MNDFADALKQHRELSGMTRLQLSARSGNSPSSITRWEKGSVLPTLENAEHLDNAVNAHGELLASWRRSTAAGGLPEWATTLDAVERRAVYLSIVSPTLVPGYLQCPEYARYLFRTAQPYASTDEIERLTTLRCERLEGLPELAVRAVFPLLAVTGISDSLTALQARHLLTWAETGRVIFHVVPDGRTLAAPGSPVMEFRLQGGDSVTTCDHAMGSVTLTRSDAERAAPHITSAVGAALPPDLSLAALERLT